MREFERKESLKRLLQDFKRSLRAESNLKLIIANFSSQSQLILCFANIYKQIINQLQIESQTE